MKQSLRQPLTLIKPYDLQYIIWKSPIRFKVAALGRRAGKTELAKLIVAEELIKNKGNIAWIAPAYKMMVDYWGQFYNAFNGNPATRRISQQEKTIELYNGGRITFWSGDGKSAEAIRGQSLTLAIFDEYAMIEGDELWNNIVRPALSDKQGKAYFFSTPAGYNHFYELFTLGKEKKHGFFSWQAPTSINPFFPKDELELVRETTPSKAYRQEYEAQFLEDAGEVFSNVMGVSSGLHYPPYEGNFIFGIDWGRVNDYTVISIFDVDKKSQVAYERFTDLDYDTQINKIEELYKTWKPNVIVAESNSFGDANIVLMHKKGIPVRSFYTSYNSKIKIIDELKLAIEKSLIVLIRDMDQIKELQYFSQNKTPSGKITYSAPKGQHDDMVMALAFAYDAYLNGMHSWGGTFPRL